MCVRVVLCLCRCLCVCSFVLWLCCLVVGGGVPSSARRVREWVGIPQECGPALASLGVQRVRDLEVLREADLDAAGLRVVPRRRILEAFSRRAPKRRRVTGKIAH